MEALKGGRNRTTEGFLFQIAFDFVAQLENIMEADGIDRTELAERLGVSKGRVSQILNNPGNLSLHNIVQYSRALDHKVAIVTYDDRDTDRGDGPINPQIFVACWDKAGKPTDFFSIGAITAATTDTKVGRPWAPIRVPTPDGLDEQNQTHPADSRLNYDLEKLEQYAGTNTTSV